MSYRPVSFISCLCKSLEKIIAARLEWFIKSKGILHKSQAGFRKHRNTKDHIIQLEVDVKEGFTARDSTVAVFLDISKAYDTTWIQGLLFKLSNIGVTSPCLGWLREFLLIEHSASGSVNIYQKPAPF